MVENKNSDLPRVVHLIEDYGIVSKVVINRGTNDGIKDGDRFLIFGLGPEIDDPLTGQSLGRLEVVRGRGTVVHVQDFMATIKSVEKSSLQKKRILSQGVLLMPSVVEETGSEDLPFLDVELGDFARPV